MLKMVRDELHALGFSDEEIDGGGLRVTTTFTQKAMTAAERGVLAARPEGFSDKQLHVGGGERRARHRRAARLLRRPGLPRVPDQLGGRRRRPGSTFKPFAVAAGAQGRLLPQGHLRRQLAVHSATAPRSQRGSERGGTDYGDAVSLLTATEESINTAFVDLTDRDARRPGEDPRRPRTRWASRRTGDQDATAIPTTARPRADDRHRARHGHGQPDQHGERLRHHRQRRRRADVHVIEKVVDADGETLYDHKVTTGRRARRRTSPPTRPTPCSRSSSTAPAPPRWRSAVRPPARPAPRPTTTDEVSSAWFVGYTPQLATAVMYVRGDGNEPARRLAAVVLRW